MPAASAAQARFKNLTKDLAPRFLLTPGFNRPPMAFHDHTIIYTLFTFIIYTIFSASPAAGQAPPDAACDSDLQAQSSEQQEPQAAPAEETGHEKKDTEPGLLDITQGFLSKAFSGPAIWFDSFFGETTGYEEAYPGTFVRWQNGIRWSEHQNPIFQTTFNASIRLPKLKKRLRLFIIGEREEEPTPVSPPKIVDPSLAAAQTPRPTDLGLRYDVVQKLYSKFDIGAGVRIKKLQPFVRARYRYTHPLTKSLLARFAETAYYWDNDGFVETSRIDIEKTLSPSLLLRLANSVTYAEHKRGVDWVPETTLYYQLSLKDAVSLDISALFVTRPEPAWVNFRMGIKYRRNFYKPWLFYEIEPEISWPRNAYHKTTSISAITVRLEVQFGHR